MVCAACTKEPGSTSTWTQDPDLPAVTTKICCLDPRSKPAPWQSSDRSFSIRTRHKEKREYKMKYMNYLNKVDALKLVIGSVKILITVEVNKISESVAAQNHK